MSRASLAGGADKALRVLSGHRVKRFLRIGIGECRTDRGNLVAADTPVGFSLPGPSTLCTTSGVLPRNASTRAVTAWSVFSKVCPVAGADNR
jgi:hypothetical protein